MFCKSLNGKSHLRVAIVLLLIWFGLPVCAECPVFLPGISMGTQQSPAINEASGIAASRKNPQVLWVHNDSGDSARVFAIRIDGVLLGTYNLSGAGATDWEDMAIGPGPIDGVDYLYLGDIGDNNAVRSHVNVYRVAEPAVDTNQSPVTMTLTGVNTIRLQYPDGARDAETLMVDPPTRDIYIVSKRESLSRVYRAEYPQSTSSISVMEYKCSLPWGYATGGDISQNGSEVIVRGYFNASIWQKNTGSELWQAFSNQQCNVSLQFESQGEAVCFVKDFACGYLTTSEHLNQNIYYYERVLEGDLDGNCIVDLADMSVLAGFWLEDNCSLNDDCYGADISQDGTVDLIDFSIFGQDWLFGQ